MDKPSIEQVFQAIDALYTGQDATGKETASKWLEELQNSVWNLHLFYYYFIKY